MASVPGVGAGLIPSAPFSPVTADLYSNRYPVDFSDVRGQEFAKRAQVVAAADRQGN
jgi:predicted ATPase with chaperone activity